MRRGKLASLLLAYSLTQDRFTWFFTDVLSFQQKCFLCLFSLCSGYGLGKQFTQQHEVTTDNTIPQDSEQEIGDETKHLVSLPTE